MLPAKRHKQTAYSLFPTAPATHREPLCLATVKVTIFNRSCNVKAFLATPCLQSVAALLPEKPVPLLPRLLRRFIIPGLFLPVGAPEEIAKIAGCAVTHRFAPGLPALVGGMRIMECAIVAASHVAAAPGADVPPAHHAGHTRTVTKRQRQRVPASGRRHRATSTARRVRTHALLHWRLTTSR